jgi:hypothetical protein
MEEVIEFGRTTVGPSNDLAFALFRFGQALRWEEDQAWALDLMQQGLVLYRSLDNLAPIPHVLRRLGEVFLAQGDYVAARARFAESWVMGHELGNSWDTVGALLGLGHVALAEGDAHSAHQSYREALLLCMRLPDWDDRRRHTGVAAALVGLLNTDFRTGSEQIVRLRGAAAAYRMAIGQAVLNELEGHSGLPSDRARDAHILELTRTDLGETAFEAAWTAGQHMPINDAIAEALAFTASSTATA